MAARCTRSHLVAALAGSALLHLGVLYGVHITPPSQTHILQTIAVHLAGGRTQPDTSPQVQRAQQLHKTLVAPPAGLLTEAQATYSEQPTLRADLTLDEQPGAVPATHETAYYAADQVDTPPRMLGEIQQIYPSRARTAEIEGFVTLALLINERGEVDEISVTNEQPQGYFEETTLAMMRNQRFAPALKHNQAVKSRWMTTVRYRLQGYSDVL